MQEKLNRCVLNVNGQKYVLTKQNKEKVRCWEMPDFFRANKIK